MLVDKNGNEIKPSPYVPIYLKASYLTCIDKYGFSTEQQIADCKEMAKGIIEDLKKLEAMNGKEE